MRTYKGVILGSEDIEGGRSGRVSTYRGVIQVGEDIEGGHPRKRGHRRGSS